MNENPLVQSVDDVIRVELNSPLTEEEKLIASLPSNDPDTPELPAEEKMKPAVVTSSFNPLTGISTPLAIDDIEPEVESAIKKAEEDSDPSRLLNKLLTAGDITFDDITNAVKKTMEGATIFDIQKVTEAVQIFIKEGGEKHNYYNDLPQSIQEHINAACATNGNLTDMNTIKSMKKAMAKDFIESIAYDCITKDNSIDLDDCMSELRSLQDELQNGIKEAEAGVRINLITKVIENYDKQIAEYKETDPEKAAELETSVAASLKESLNLTKFKEFCKTIKVKKFDAEKPNRIFESFNSKYYTHKLNINDIRSCPAILANHITDHVDDRGVTKVCVAFCKYCLNFSPDTPKEHIFMYYFIANIYLMNLIYPSGLVVTTDSNADKSMHEFYVKFKANLTECIENIR